MGTGFSGLCAAVYMKHGLQNFDLQIYEKTDDVGGVCEWTSCAGEMLGLTTRAPEPVRRRCV